MPNVSRLARILCVFWALMLISGHFPQPVAAAADNGAAEAWPGIPQALFADGASADAEGLAPAPARKRGGFFKVRLTRPSGYREPVALDFYRDDQACKDAYGKDWQQRCMGRPGLYNEPAGDVTLEPARAGSWWWSSPYRLIFTPRDGWEPDETFTLTLADSTLRPQATLTGSGQLTFTTPPDAATVDPGQLWIDPSSAGEHGVTFFARFLYPQPEEADRAFAVEVLENVDVRTRMLLGQPRIVWNHGRTEASVSIPVHRLSDQVATVLLKLKGYPVQGQRDGRVVTLRDQEPEGRLLINAKNHLLSLGDFSIRVAEDNALRKEYRLSVKSNALLTPSALLASARAVQLPLRREAQALEPFNWREAPAITEEDMAAGKTLRLEAITPLEQPSTTIVFRLPDFDPDSGSFVRFQVDGTLEAPSGIGLGRNFDEVAEAPRFQRELRFLQQGSVLALGSDGRLGLQSSGLHCIRWSVTQLRPEYISQFSALSGSFEHPSMSMDAYGTRTEGEIALPQVEPGEPQFSTLDLRPLLADGKGVFSVELSGIVKDEQGKDQRAASARRFVLATDIGLMIKQASDGSRSVFVCSISDSKPLSRVKLDVLGANGLPVVSAQSDVEGRAELPSLDGFRREKYPTVLVARRGADLSFLPLEDGSLLASTAYQTGSSLQNQSFVFSQRSLYRPGETMHFGTILRDEGFAPFPADVPLEGVIILPGGNDVRLPLQLDPSGMAAVSWDIPENARTGTYDFQVRVADGSASGNRSGLVLGWTAVAVRDFQPDLLSASLQVKDADGNPVPAPGAGWVRTEDLTATASLRNMFGTAAQDRRVTAVANSHPPFLRFNGYEDYQFHETGSLPSRNLELEEQRTDEAGQATFRLNLDRLWPDFSSQRLSNTVGLFIQGFEPGGGRSVTQQAQFMVSPMPYMLGVRPSANLDFIPAERNVTLDFVALDNRLNQIDPGPLTVVISEQRNVLHLVSDPRGAYRYENKPEDKELSRETVRFQTGPDGPALRYTLPTATPGLLALSVLDAEGGLVSHRRFQVVGNTVRSENAWPLMRVALEKDDYAPGESLRVAFTAPYDGLGLLTLERDRVYSHVWFRARAGESLQALKIPEDFEGRGYLNVSFIRSLQSPDIYMAPHVYHVEPVAVNIAKRDMHVQVEAPELVRPGEPVTVLVRARDRGSVIVFAVDEGILQLARFATPSPVDALLKRRGLAVRTFQAFDLLMPDQRHIRAIVSAFGGGARDIGMQDRFLNPFKRKGEPPVATWSGPLEVGPGGTRVTLDIPEYYSGKVRIMAVGSGKTAVGSTSASMTARGPLVITPQFLAMAAPGDVFDASFGIANPPDGGPGAISLRLEAGAGLEVVGTLPDQIVIEPGDESVLPLQLRVLDNPGGTSCTLVATIGGREVRRTATLSVRPLSPRMGSLQSGFTGTGATLRVDRDLYPDFAMVEASASPLPLPAIRGLVRYLDTYPYGCTEQVVSRAFPYALLLKHPALLRQAGEDPEALHKRAQLVVRNTVNMIRSRHIQGSGMSAWPGSWDTASTQLTAYTADFLLTVREAGLNLATDLEQRIIGDLRNRLGRQLITPADARAHAYGTWVLSRHGDITSRQITQLIEFMRSDMPDWNKDVTAVLMAAAFAVMRLEEGAAQSIDAYELDPSLLFGKNDDGLFDQLACDALYLTILSRHFPERLAAFPPDERRALIDGLVEQIRDRRYSTFSSSQAVRALLSLVEAVDTEPPSLTCLDGDASPLDLGPGISALTTSACTTFSLSVPEGHPGVYWQVFADGFDRLPDEKSLAAGLEISREVLDDEGEPVTAVKLGEEVNVRLSVRSYNRSVSNVALVSLLPGGFELVEVRPDQRPESDPDEDAFLVQSVDRREDRVLVFGTAQTRWDTYTYRIRAVNTGRFALPPAYAEAMYSQTLRARSETSTIEVRKP